MTNNGATHTTPSTLMPSLFISHGAPTLPIEESPARDFFLGLGDEVPSPAAILIVSAHWDTDSLGLLAGAQTLDTIHDFYGFPQALYDMQYPAPGIDKPGIDKLGNDTLSEKIVTTLNKAGFKVSVDGQRGLDHGAWVPLKLMYPQADIPVTQVSVNTLQSPEYHWRLGRALAPLRQDNVLIIGSGTMTHNLSEVGNFHGERNAFDEADYVTEFSRWMETKILDCDIDALLQYQTRAPHAERAHPTTEHLLPLYVALGAAGVSWQAELLHRSCVYGVINLDSYLFKKIVDNTETTPIS